MPIALVCLLPIIFHGDRETALAICSSWKTIYEEFPWCDWNSGITALGWDTTQQFRHLREILQDTAAAALFLVGLILSILPYLVFYGVSHFKTLFEGMRPGILKLLATLSMLTPLALFIIGGWDYGRWIHLVTAGFMVVIFCDPRFDRFEAPWDSVLNRARGLEAVPYLLIGVMGGGITLNEITSGQVPEWVGGLLVSAVVVTPLLRYQKSAGRPLRCGKTFRRRYHGSLVVTVARYAHRWRTCGRRSHVVLVVVTRCRLRAGKHPPWALSYPGYS